MPKLMNLSLFSHALIDFYKLEVPVNWEGGALFIRPYAPLLYVTRTTKNASFLKTI